jgi:uncharacterized SAM-binding protein YcdF (DUF218 family)
MITSQPQIRRPNALGAAWRFTRNFLVLIGFLWLFATVTPADSWWATQLAGPWTDPKGDVLVVLGGSILEDGVLGESSYWRAVYAVRVWKEGGFKQVVVCGGNSTASAMRDFLVANGVPDESVIVESDSRSTRENALFAKPILTALPGTKVLLTSDYHMFRAARTFSKAGITIAPRPFPDVRKRSQHLLSRWGAFLDLTEESMKIVFYKMKGWI